MTISVNSLVLIFIFLGRSLQPVGYGLIYGGFPQPSENFLKDLKKT